MSSSLPDSLRTRRLLIVEDDRDFAESLFDLLEPLGFSVRTAASCGEAIAALADFSADIALVDVKLGAESGVGLVPQLRQRRPALICILMTAYAALDSAVAAVRCGATDYLRKPLEPSELVEKLEHALEQNERALRQQREQRLLVMGELCAGIAHDVNNCLQVMMNEVTDLDLSLKRAPPDLERARSGALSLDRSVQTVASVCQRILAFAKGTLVSEGCDAGKVLTSSTPLLTKLTQRGVRLSVEVPDQTLWVGLDAVQLQQVILNLVLNASQAAREDGTVRVELSEHANPQLRSARLRVVDDGCGIPDAVRPRIFDPYFSTKPSGEGTGLGLSIVYGMVNAAGGDIQVESAVGRGSCFDVVLPLTEPPERSDWTARSAVRARRLLIVDDLPTILRAIDRTFSALGYETLCATSAEQALSLMEAASEPIDGVISDVHLPGISGVDLAWELRQKRPNLPIVLLSGDTGNLPGIERFGGRITLLGKPFRLAALVEEFEDT